MAIKGLIPHTSSQLCEELGKLSKNGRIISGGTDLIIKLRNGRSKPDMLLYLGQISEYNKIELIDDKMHIGSMVTMSELAKSDLIRNKLTALYDGARDLGSEQIRNNATIGGNFMSASPAGDLIPILFMFDAVAVVANPSGEFTNMKVHDVVIGAGKTSLEYNQCIVKFIIPISNDMNYYSTFLKLGSRDMVTISRIAMTLAVSFDDKGLVLKSKIYLGSVAPVPIRMVEAEKLMIGNKIDSSIMEQVSESIAKVIYELTPKGCERHDECYYENFYRFYKVASIRGVVEDVFNNLIKH